MSETQLQPTAAASGETPGAESAPAAGEADGEAADPDEAPAAGGEAAEEEGEGDVGAEEAAVLPV